MYSWNTMDFATSYNIIQYQGAILFQNGLI